MKTAAVLLLGIALPVLAGGPEDRPTPEATPEPKQEWPQKGDTVYLAAKLEWMQSPAGIGTPLGMAPRTREELAPCSPLIIFHRNDNLTKLDTTDDLARLHKMIGPGWLRLLSRTRDDCLEQIKKEGEPRVQSRMSLAAPIPQFRLVSDIEAEKKADH